MFLHISCCLETFHKPFNASYFAISQNIKGYTQQNVTRQQTHARGHALSILRTTGAFVVTSKTLFCAIFLILLIAIFIITSRCLHTMFATGWLMHPPIHFLPIAHTQPHICGCGTPICGLFAWLCRLGVHLETVDVHTHIRQRTHNVHTCMRSHPPITQANTVTTVT